MRGDKSIPTAIENIGLNVIHTVGQKPNAYQEAVCSFYLLLEIRLFLEIQKKFVITLNVLNEW